MTTFAELLERRRTARGLNRSELAHEVGLSPQYISALENPLSGKTPSAEALLKLIAFFGGGGSEGQADWETKVRFAFAAVGLHEDVDLPLPVTLENELREQENEGNAAEFWIISDLIAEGIHREVATRTARNIVENSARYTYFVPATPDADANWRRALRYMGEEIRELAKDVLLEERITIYRVSSCAFTARCRITNPSSSPNGTYSLGGRSAPHALFYPMPIDLLSQTVRTFDDLLAEHAEQERDDRPTAWAGKPRTGFIKRVFPLPTAL